jgi:hypothetical protein
MAIGSKRESLPRIQGLRFSVTLAPPKKIQTRRKRRRKMRLSRFTFLNYTKMTRYEALEKNVVSTANCFLFGNLQYGP